MVVTTCGTGAVGKLQRTPGEKTSAASARADAAEVFSPGVRCSFPTAPVPQVVTTIGAGDNFNAGIVYSLVREDFTRERLSALSAADWALLIPTAMRFSAEVCGSLFNYVDPDFLQELE